ncbi:MAG TPA: hypothetical protein DCQ98_02185 [Planctomycetaceae bacterium]|nr:hypothetical protein [Planctomycetaceae bacterium]
MNDTPCDDGPPSVPADGSRSSRTRATFVDPVPDVAPDEENGGIPRGALAFFVHRVRSPSPGEGLSAAVRGTERRTGG